MRTWYSKSLAVVFALLVLVVCGSAGAQQPPDYVQGSWTIYSRNIDNGEMVTKFVHINQNGNQLTGHFRGPNQSGGIEGFVNGHHIEFSTKTRTVLTFRGQIEGNQITGLYGIRGRHAEWQAVRQ